MAERMGACTVGNGLEPGVLCGPMINQEAVVSISDLVQQAIEEGAEAVVGGGAIDGPGYFFEPTVLKGVTARSAITRHEIFGPVAPIISFTDTDSMIADANDTEMGLTAYVYSGDFERGLRVSERLEAGMVGLNRGSVSDPAAPFGGMKQSGLGREGAGEGIYEFTETQYIATQW
jgi:succinate-semialdehyde dehydrogenase/glutarate-semialdehyde dehydrogenase